MSEIVTQLSPGTRLLWRSETAVQLELGSRRVLVDGVSSATVRSLLGRKSNDDPPVTEGADSTSVQEALLENGFLWTAASPEDDPRRAPPTPRLAGELAALTVQHGDRAAEVLAARTGCAVAVHGAGRIGPLVAALVAAAGVGRVHALERSAVRLHQAAPGGVRPSDEGSRLDGATAAAVGRCAPEVDTTAPALGDRPDLVVLALDGPIDPEHRAALHARRCAHLLVTSGPDHGAVGPLVLPGLTSCLTCADLHRRDRDPAWDVLAVQLSQPHRTVAASQVALSSMIAGLAAMQVLSFLDGDRPSAIEGTLEIQLPDIRVRRRSWPPHGECDCMC